MNKETTEIRLLQANLEDKLKLNKGFEDIKVFCAYCNCGISHEGKPIHYTTAQKKEIEEKYRISHGICKLDYCIEIHKLKVLQTSQDYILKNDL